MNLERVDVLPHMRAGRATWSGEAAVGKQVVPGKRPSGFGCDL